MLDITELDRTLSMQAVTKTSGREPRWEVISPADYSLPSVVPIGKPVVTWRVTRSCNLECLSCFHDPEPRRYGAELTAGEGLALINDLAAWGVPRLLLSGGEPLMRADLLELVAYARERGMQPSILTNGTLLSRERAAELKRAGTHSVTILLDGIGHSPMTAVRAV